MSEREYAVKIRDYALQVKGALDYIEEERPDQGAQLWVTQHLQSLAKRMREKMAGELSPGSQREANIIRPLLIAWDLLNHPKKGLPHDALMVSAASTLVDLVIENYPR